MQQLSFSALKQLRGDATNAMLARRALPKASETTVKSLANYFSRVINGGVPHVSMKMLALLAEGLEYDSLGVFFTDWELATLGQPLPPRKRTAGPNKTRPYPTVFAQIQDSHNSPSTTRKNRGKTGVTTTRPPEIGRTTTGATNELASLETAAQSFSSQLSALALSLRALRAAVDRPHRGARPAMSRRDSLLPQNHVGAHPAAAPRTKAK